MQLTERHTLTPKELDEYTQHARSVGAISDSAVLKSVSFSVPLGADRADAMAELKRMSEARAQGKSKPLSFGDLRWKE